MLKNSVSHPDLQYLNNRPKRIYWKVVAGPPNAKLTSLQEYDLIYDERDLKLRKLDTKENLEILKRKELK